MDCSMPGPSVYGVLSGKNTGVGDQSLLQGIFLTQGLNPGLLEEKCSPNVRSSQRVIISPSDISSSCCDRMPVHALTSDPQALAPDDCWLGDSIQRLCFFIWRHYPSLIADLDQIGLIWNKSPFGSLVLTLAGHLWAGGAGDAWVYFNKQIVCVCVCVMQKREVSVTSCTLNFWIFRDIFVAQMKIIRTSANCSAGDSWVTLGLPWFRTSLDHGHRNSWVLSKLQLLLADDLGQVFWILQTVPLTVVTWDKPLLWWIAVPSSKMRSEHGKRAQSLCFLLYQESGFWNFWGVFLRNPHTATWLIKQTEVG